MQTILGFCTKEQLVLREAHLFGINSKQPRRSWRRVSKYIDKSIEIQIYMP